MKIEVIATAAEVNRDRVEGKVACIIDVFRATSVMTTALNNGAKRIIPMTGIEECFELKATLIEQKVDQKVILAGERKMVLIEGFELDNSPLSFTADKVSGATIIMSTTNGTRALNCANGAQHTYIASMLDTKAVCKKILEHNSDIVLICSGRNNRFTLEDGLCAGKMIHELRKDQRISVNSDMAWMLCDMYERYRDNIEEIMQNCKHYKRLLDLGMSSDVEYCLSQDVFSNVVELVHDPESVASKYGELKICR